MCDTESSQTPSVFGINLNSYDLRFQVTNSRYSFFQDGPLRSPPPSIGGFSISSEGVPWKAGSESSLLVFQVTIDYRHPLCLDAKSIITQFMSNHRECKPKLDPSSTPQLLPGEFRTPRSRDYPFNDFVSSQRTRLNRCF